MTPAAQTSTSMPWQPLRFSGAMYSGVPVTCSTHQQYTHSARHQSSNEHQHTVSTSSILAQQLACQVNHNVGRLPHDRKHVSGATVICTNAGTAGLST
jgi:hypothetical protein